MLTLLAISGSSLNAQLKQETNNKLTEDRFDTVKIESNGPSGIFERNANNLPVNISVITEDQIKKLPVQTIVEALQFLTGVDIQQRGVNGTQADVGIAGGTFDQTLILIDGVRMMDGQTGHHQLNIPIPLETVKQIEVYRGSVGHLFGANAVAGAINIVTKTRVNAISATVYTGSKLNISDTLPFYRNMGLRVLMPFNLDKYGLFCWVSASADLSNGYRYNTQFDNYKTLMKLTKINDFKGIGRNEFTFFGGTVNNSFGANGFYAFPYDINSVETVNTQFLQFSDQIKLHNNWLIKISYSSRYNFDHYVFIQSNPTYYQNKHQGIASMPSVLIQREYKNGLRVSLGFEGRFETLKSNNLGNRSRQYQGGYLSFSYYLKPIKMILNPAVYVINSDMIGTKINPGIDFSMPIMKSTSLSGQFGIGQRLPTFTDLYYSDPVHLSNPLLKPEYSKSFEFGIKYNTKFIKTQLSILNRNARDLIDWQKDQSTNYFIPLNILGVNYKGVQFGLTLKNKFGEIQYTSMNLKPVITSSNGQDISLTNLNLNTVQWQHVFKLNSQITNRISIGLQARFIQKINSQNSYRVYSAKVNYTVNSDFNLYLNVQNLTNAMYKEIGSIPMPSRWFTLGIQYNLQ